MADLEIFALVLGHSLDSIFSVTARDDTSVSTWREQVHAKAPSTLKKCKPSDLALWKLKQAIPSVDVNKKMDDLGQDISSFAEKMQPAMDLSDYFSVSLPRKSLHVIVVPSLPSAGEKHGLSEDDADSEPAAKRKKGPRPSDPADGLYSRSETVEALYEKLKEHKFIFVRGTPASGKSSLAMLLRKYITENHPEKHTCILARYRDEPEEKPIMGWQEWLEGQGWKSPSNGVLIIDEAQLSYWDDTFWLAFIKPINASTEYMVILFASYGSANRNILNKLTPLVVEEDQLVGLARGTTEASVGLLLTEKEMEGVVKKSFPNHHFDVSLLGYVHSLTSGHVGACYDALSVVYKHQSYRGNNREYTYKDFILNFEMSTFLKKLSDRGIFSRGLPMQDDLEDPKKPFVRNLRDVLNAPSRSVLLEKEDDQRGSKHPLRLCLEQGWLFSKPTDGAKVEYRFASQLHLLYTEWLLLRREDLIKDPDLQTFVIEVIKHFSPQNLQARGDLSTTPQPIPEAQFQQEFYRACGVYTGGCVTTFPECGTPKGRIDFFIRSKKWGVELLRNGSRLRNHHDRFTTGEYGTWLREGTMKDYVMIDFRSTKPKQASDIEPLIYVVSTDNWESLEIYDHNLENIKSFRLFYHNL